MNMWGVVLALGLVLAGLCRPGVAREIIEEAPISAIPVYLVVTAENATLQREVTNYVGKALRAKQDVILATKESTAEWRIEVTAMELVMEHGERIGYVLTYTLLQKAHFGDLFFSVLMIEKYLSKADYQRIIDALNAVEKAAYNVVMSSSATCRPSGLQSMCGSLITQIDAEFFAPERKEHQRNAEILEEIEREGLLDPLTDF